MTAGLGTGAGTSGLPSFGREIVLWMDDLDPEIVVLDGRALGGIDHAPEIDDGLVRRPNCLLYTSDAADE